MSHRLRLPSRGSGSPQPSPDVERFLSNLSRLTLSESKDAAASQGPSHRNQSAAKTYPYSIRAIEGKGLGFIACRDITQGELIVEEKPLLLAQRPGFSSQEIHDLVTTLNAEDRAKYQSLHHYSTPCERDDMAEELGVDPDSADGEEAVDVIGIWGTNSFRNERGTCVGVAVEASRINHSCVPNATWLFEDQGEIVSVRAQMPIAKGAEITISYVDQSCPLETRTSQLLQYGFRSQCPICPSRSNPNQQHVHEVDRRRGELDMLRERILQRLPTWSEERRLRRAIALAEDIKQLLEEDAHKDSLMWSRALALRELAMLYARQGDHDRARSNMDQALPLLRICCGCDYCFTTEAEDKQLGSVVRLSEVDEVEVKSESSQ